MKPLELLETKRKHIERLTNQRGLIGEQTIIGKMENWVQRPKGLGLKVLLSELEIVGISIKGTSFDAVNLQGLDSIDFTNASLVREMLPKMTFIEIKTSNQERVKPNFEGFFFALTENEIRASDVLGIRHKVALHNAVTGEVLITSVPEILARTKSMNWQLSVQL